MNVVVSAGLTPGGTARKALVVAVGLGSLAFTNETFEEMAAVLARPRLARAMGAIEIESLLSLLRAASVYPLPGERVLECRDPKDDRYLEAAVWSGADAILSGDNDLLELGPWRGIPILHPSDFIVWLANRGVRGH